MELIPGIRRPTYGDALSFTARMFKNRTTEKDSAVQNLTWDFTSVALKNDSDNTQPSNP